MGLSDDVIATVELAALVHDIGKLAVPAELLTRPTQLSEIEFRLIREHPLTSHEILKGIAFPWPIADIVLQHHERCDGSGYPYGLLRDGILLPARILAVADVVEAMASHRPYLPALGMEAAIAEIVGEPAKYDADAAAACVRLYESGRIDL
jgi:HD-GYP domain-containing protein (c-di-GMP phosphodiesterase class II)